MVVGCLSLSTFACGTFRNAAAATPTPSTPPATPACITAAPEPQAQAADPTASNLFAATQEVNAGQRNVESRRGAAKTTNQKKDLDRSHVMALGKFRQRLYAIDFPPQQNRAVAQLLRTTAAEQTAYIHAAGAPDPDSPGHLKQIDDSTKATRSASNQLRSGVGLPQATQCI